MKRDSPCRPTPEENMYLFNQSPLRVTLSRDLGLTFQCPSATRPLVQVPPPYLNLATIVVQSRNGYVSLPALRVLLANHVTITLLDSHGKLLGMATPPMRKSGPIWLKQVETRADPVRRLRIAKTILSWSFKARAASIGRLLNASSIQLLVAAESHLAEENWAKFRSALSTVWPEHDFTTRRATPLRPTARKATSRVNAALNYGFSLAESTARVTCYRVGLHPAVGFIHQTTESQEGMVYDLEELIRGDVEAAVLHWFEDRAHQTAFYRSDDWTTVLTPDGARSLVSTVSPAIDRGRLLRRARRIVQML